MNSGGTGYTSQPSITIVGGGGTGAAAWLHLFVVPIKSIGVTSGGASYTSTPDVTLSSGTGAVAEATCSRRSYVSSEC